MYNENFERLPMLIKEKNNIKLRRLDTKLLLYLCQKLRLPVTDYIFTIKTPHCIVKISEKKFGLNCVCKQKIKAETNETNASSAVIGC